MLSERDILHALAVHGTAMLALKAEGLMTCEVVTCSREDTLQSVMVKVTQRRIRHLPVVEQGQLASLLHGRGYRYVPPVTGADRGEQEEAVRMIAALENYREVPRHPLTKSNIARFASVARDRLRNENASLRKGYMRHLVSRVEVSDREIRIS